jgi:3-methyladenine DNA glycosylase AlkD
MPPRASTSPLGRRIRAALEAAGDPDRARGQQAYMKTEAPFAGVRVPQVRKLCRAIFAEVSLPDAATWRAEVEALWRGARYREERYAACVLAGDRRARAFQDLAALALYERLIVEGAWWDLVDDVAVHLVGPMLDGAHARRVAAALRRWAKDADPWRRRAAIVAQVGRRGREDVALLRDCLAPSLGEPGFFLRKGIGWALRSLADTQPEVVRRYVAEHPELSPLSRREALRKLT